MKKKFCTCSTINYTSTKKAYQYTGKSHKRKINIDIDYVEIKALIQETHTTIGQKILLREETHIQQMQQTNC